MDNSAPFIKFNMNKFAWENYKKTLLGNHIYYCESHIEKCDVKIAEQNSRKV